MENEKLNEWTNYETSAVAHWIMNDRINRQRWDELAQQSVKLSSRPEELYDDAVAFLADELKFVIGRSVPQELMEIHRDLVFAALGKVDWAQIAKNCLGIVTVIETAAEIWNGPRPGSDAEPKFSLGQIVTAEGASGTIDVRNIQEALARHQRGDWGDCCADDWQANDDALRDGHGLHSIYRSWRGNVFWILTEPDRAVTTVLLPSEY